MVPRVLAAVLCGMFLSATAFANCPVPEVKANGEFFKAQVVFTGTVVSERYVKGADWGWFYRVQVQQILKGPINKELTVYTGDDSNRFPLEKGREYLLFAYRRDGRLEIDSCGNSALASEAANSLQLIHGNSRRDSQPIQGSSSRH